ncbi:MAG: cation diffusion facilitator family transporter [Candidatus Gracilibacteria bacterium]|nr:cation diffusion facilitator family transporter [Candidatus Gracilibacteria bacterium]
MNLERKATVVSTITAIFLVIIKVIVGIFSGSIAIISSAVDSVLDMFVSMFNFLALKHSEKKSDDLFNFGRGKFEALAAFIEGLVIAISGGIILYESIIKLLDHDEIKVLEAGILVMIVSIVATGALVKFLDSVYKKTNSLVTKADSLHYKTDLYANAGILFSLIIIKFTGLHFIDSLVGGAIAIFIIYSAYEIIKKGFLLLLDVALDENEVDKIKDIIITSDEVTGFHHLKTRASGKVKMVSVHAEFNPHISLLEAHKIADKIEESIKKIDKKSEWETIIHLDPYDDSNPNLTPIDKLKNKSKK